MTSREAREATHMVVSLHQVRANESWWHTQVTGQRAKQKQQCKLLLAAAAAALIKHTQVVPCSCSVGKKQIQPNSNSSSNFNSQSTIQKAHSQSLKSPIAPLGVDISEIFFLSGVLFRFVQKILEYKSRPISIHIEGGWEPQPKAIRRRMTTTTRNLAPEKRALLPIPTAKVTFFISTHLLFTHGYFVFVDPSICFWALLLWQL